MTDKNLKILLVDDFDTMLKIIRDILNNLGYENIVTAKNGKLACRILNTEKIDLVISDWNMPEMTGLELLKTVRATPEHADIPFIMVTAEAEKVHIIEAVKANVSQYIIKPFKGNDLAKKIDFVLKDR